MEAEYSCAQCSANEFLSTSSSGEPKLHFEFAERKVGRLDKVGAIDNPTYRTINREIDTLAASKQLRKLCDCGLLVKKGNGPATYYEPTERRLENWTPGTSNTVKSPVLDAKKQELDGKSTEVRDRIVGVGRKSDKSALLQLVVDILTERHLSAGELAMLLGRTQKHVRTEYLQPLLDDARVVRPNPDKPTDPNQIYMAGDIKERPQ